MIEKSFNLLPILQTNKLLVVVFLQSNSGISSVLMIKNGLQHSIAIALLFSPMLLLYILTLMLSC